MILDIPYSRKDAGLGTLQAEVVFVVLFSVGIGMASETVLSRGMSSSIGWGLAHGMATLAAWRLPWIESLARRHWLAAGFVALVCGNLLGALLGGLFLAGDPLWLTHLEDGAGIHHLTTYLSLCVPVVMLIGWNERINDTLAAAAAEESGRQQARQKLAEAEHLLLTSSIQPDAFIGVLNEAAKLLAADKIRQARSKLEAAAQRTRIMLNRLGMSVPAAAIDANLAPDENTLLRQMEPYRRVTLQGVVLFECLIAAISLAESVVLGRPLLEIAPFVHIVGWSMVVSCIVIAHLTRRTFLDALPLAGGVLLGIVIGKALLGSLFFGDPLFMVSDPDGLKALPFSLFFSFTGTSLMWQHGRALQARLEYARAAAWRVNTGRQLTDARMRMLQAQIEPHFLFNTLSNVIAQSSLDRGAAQRMIALLVQLVGWSMSEGDQRRGTLGDELDGIHAYLQLQGYRIGPRLTWWNDCPVQLRACPLPPLLIQPLVENSIRHGIEAVSGEHVISVRTSRTAHGLAIDVSDTGRGMEPGYINGIGLSNLRERLATHYEGKASLEFLPNHPTGVTARLSIPL